MLTKLKLENFIHFVKPVEIDFEKGPHILIGENHTGKTSLFEAIRRCMSLCKSFGLSNAHNPKEFSYVTCVFENTEFTTYSSFIRLPIEEVVHYLKLVQVFSKKESGKDEKAADILRLVTDKKTFVNKSLSTETFDFNLKDSNDLKADITHYFLEQKDINELNNKTIHDDTLCERLLKKQVDEETIIIFPFRSFSPFQWTKSKRSIARCNDDAADEISLKEEIISWYLKEDISEEEKTLEEHYFRRITGNSGFKFKLDEKTGRVGVINKNTDGTNSANENLLKIPEGIYEAKSAAIVLANKRFTTICLDDAERGMHPQMIERVRDLVLKNINDKVVLLITHHPTFLAPWNISRTHLFRRSSDQNSYRFSVTSLSNLNEDGDSDGSGKKSAQIISSDKFANLFFAQRIFFVEGNTEYMFMAALKEYFFQKNVPSGKDSDEKETLCNFLSTLHVVSMDGEANKCRFRHICLTLDIPHFFMLDFDALLANCKGCDKENEDQVNVQKFCEAFQLKNLAKEKYDEVYKDVTLLEDDNIFVWEKTVEADKKSGTIEKAVLRMCQNNQELNEHLKDNNCDIEAINSSKKRNSSGAPKDPQKRDSSGAPKDPQKRNSSGAPKDPQKRNSSGAPKDPQKRNSSGAPKDPQKRNSSGAPKDPQKRDSSGAPKDPQKRNSSGAPKDPQKRNSSGAPKDPQRRNSSGVNKSNKLFGSQDLTNKNITIIVEKLLDSSKEEDTTSGVGRFVAFLTKQAGH